MTLGEEAVTSSTQALSMEINAGAAKVCELFERIRKIPLLVGEKR
jgi:hypothetical protein